MADKWMRRLERKIDALLEANKIDRAQFDDAAPVRAPRALSEAEQQAIANAPQAGATVPEAPRGPRVTAMNAPDTSPSVPKAASKSAKGKK